MLEAAPRNIRRAIYAEEDRARKSGAWGRWERIDTRGHGAGSGWLRHVHTVHKTDWLVVMVRTLTTDWGVVEHACIRTARHAELGWREKQRIKDEIFGPERVAVEVMPARSRVVDDADLYHLWVMPEGFAPPFGIHRLDEVPHA